MPATNASPHSAIPTRCQPPPLRPRGPLPSARSTRGVELRGKCRLITNWHDNLQTGEVHHAAHAGRPGRRRSCRRRRSGSSRLSCRQPERLKPGRLGPGFHAPGQSPRALRFFIQADPSRPAARFKQAEKTGSDPMSPWHGRRRSARRECHRSWHSSGRRASSRGLAAP